MLELCTRRGRVTLLARQVFLYLRGLINTENLQRTSTYSGKRICYKMELREAQLELGNCARSFACKMGQPFENGCHREQREHTQI
jgi:hypothetical protein